MQITQINKNNSIGSESWWVITLDDIELETHDYLEARVFIGLYKVEPGDGFSEAGSQEGYHSDPVVFNAETGESVNFDDLFLEFSGEVEDAKGQTRCTNWVIKKCDNEISNEDHEQNLIDNPILKNNPFGLDIDDYSKFGVKELCMSCAVAEGMVDHNEIA